MEKSTKKNEKPKEEGKRPRGRPVGSKNVVSRSPLKEKKGKSKTDSFCVKKIRAICLTVFIVERRDASSESRQTSESVQDFDTSFKVLKDAKYARNVKKLLFRHYKLDGYFKDIQFSDQYLTYPGQNGYERNNIIAYSGIRITDKSDRKYTIKKGDIWRLPKKEIPDHSLVYGFEVNISEDWTKIEDAHFLTRPCHKLHEIQANNYFLYNKISDIKEDQTSQKRNHVNKLLKNQESICLHDPFMEDDGDDYCTKTVVSILSKSLLPN